ncbi:cation-translocating P-type ATPase [Paenalcaligenes niemegkensis]|uniref:heavy metal translocating P-type ATPase n=1 Tax=Paenalcaligenes niemegkensis TaxID=2895469 RepID=UPI001EE961D9|nr:cation-translocating P-type ATPase [Paenalcaligenes niemegkensis]MCQ9615962.1 cation-translocating P-type ATPase [Paenalcaligenes niemegkensis]
MSTSSTHTHHGHSAACCAGTPAPKASQSGFSSAGDGQEQSTLRIEQMDCPTEEGLIRKVLGNRAEVYALEFDLMQRKLNVVHSPGFRSQLQGLIAQLGMSSELESPATEPGAKVASGNAWSSWLRIGAAVVVALVAESASWLQAPSWLVLLLSVAAIGLCGLGVYKKGWIAIRHRDLNINALMSIAVTGALVLGEWPEAAMVMSLFGLAELIEARSLDRARSAVDRLLSITPDLVDVWSAEQGWVSEKAVNVQAGALAKVLPGQRLGLDGIVELGSSAVNQAPITGESEAVTKSAGDVVYAGSINGMGELQYRITADYDHSLLARITHSVQQAQQNKAPIQRFVDRFSRIYTPVVVAVAAAIAVTPPLLGMGTFSEWVYKALVLLVIACPCALVISTPVAVVSALTLAARQGLLVKGGVYLERARQIKYVILDKTGTLTEGRPSLQDMFIAGEHAEPVKQVAYSLAMRSDHPASQALVQAKVHEDTIEIQDFMAVPGKGVQGLAGNICYRLGSKAWAAAEGAGAQAMLTQWEAGWQARGASFVYLHDGKTIVAAFAVNDAIKSGVKTALQRLRSQGVSVSIASGDNEHAVRAVATAVGIDEFQADLLPEEKLTLLTQHQQTGVVAMVGDGINDAPALAQADIGFAMGALGSDVAIETADVAILNDDLNKIPDVLQLSKRLHRVLVQNISTALAIKAIFLGLAMTGGASMWMAVFADVGASLLVVLNSLRLLR